MKFRISYLAALLVAAPVFAQQDQPREQQRSSPIQASVLLRTADGGYRQANVEDTFFDGQRFRLRVNSNLDGYLYALCLNSQGSALVLFPNSQGEPANHLYRNRRVTIPDNAWFQFDREPGTERVYLVMSERPIAELERASQRGGEIDRRLLDKYVRAGGGESGDKGIGLSGDDDSYVVRRIDLLHEPRN
jgi:hypothetical protein